MVQIYDIYKVSFQIVVKLMIWGDSFQSIHLTGLFMVALFDIAVSSLPNFLS